MASSRLSSRSRSATIATRTRSARRSPIAPPVTTSRRQRPNRSGPIRYAVVGLGHIAQVAVLPAFAHARNNSVLTAFVSDNPRKHQLLGKKYRVNQHYSYKEYEACLHSGHIDAVYIALPNSMHCEFATRAAQAGIHVLCEKPLATNEQECEEIIRACADNHVQLMTAYRLHFERANLEAVKLIKAGAIGEPRFFNSLFSMQVREGNIRTQRELGGGTLYDIGIYCINAARYLFRAEPTEVFAYSSRTDDKRFREIDEMTSALLRFPEDRLATFTSSFGAKDMAVYDVVGTKGSIRVENAYEYSGKLELTLESSSKKLRRSFGRSDQFAPELIYFSDCIRRNKEPEPSGVEGLLDVHIVRSLYESARTGVPVRTRDLTRQRRPDPRQEIRQPAVREPQLVEVRAASRD